MPASVQDVMAVLESAAFERLPKPLSVAGTEFDFEAAALGTRPSNDLVVVATNEFPRQRLQRLVAGLARSLDLAASRRPVSLVLIGNVAANDRGELERYARVLSVDTESADAGHIKQAVAVLLPLALPATELMHGGDPINEVMAVLGPSTTSEHIALVRAAIDGTDAVREALRDFANDGAEWSDGTEGAEDV
jgi:hypothetical protein